MSDQRTPSAFSLSLKELLAIAVFFGPGIGILGNIYNGYPQYFQPALVIFFAAIPFLLASATLIRLGFQRGHRKLLLWGMLILCMPLLGGITYWLVPISKNGIDHLSTRMIIEKQIPKKWNNRSIWRELNRRIDKGEISEKQANDALESLVSKLNSLTPSRSIHFLEDAQKFIEKSELAGILPQASIATLCDAGFGEMGEVHVLEKRRRKEDDLACVFRINQGHHIYQDNYPIPIWFLEQVFIDGSLVDFLLGSKNENHGGHHVNQTQIVYFPNTFDIPLDNINSGKHRLTVKARFAYAYPNNLRGLNAGHLAKEKWPETIKEWERTVETNFLVYGPNESFVELVSDPKFDPVINKQVIIEQLLLQKGEDDQSLLLFDMTCPSMEEVAYCFDVSIKINGTTKPVGKYHSKFSVSKWWYDYEKDGRKQSFELLIDTPSSEILSADIYLSPNNSDEYQRQSNISKLWNKPVWIRDIPIERRDLDTNESE